MSNPTTLADVLKGAPEVTSLGSEDRLLAIGADGATKRISEDKLVYPNYRSKDFPSTNTDWVRIASTPEDTPAEIEQRFNELKHCFFVNSVISQ